jgi:hypothetical protein
VRNRQTLLRVAVGALLLISVLFFADLFGAPDWLGDVASVVWSSLAVGAGVLVVRDATTQNERIAGWVLVVAGCVSLAAWALDLVV